MKKQSLLLLLFVSMVLAELSLLRQPSGKSWHPDTEMLFTPTICDLRLPDAVTNNNADMQTNVPGTSLGISLPEGYRDMEPGSYMRDKDTTINITEDHSQGFAAFKQVLDSKLADLNKYNPPTTRLLYHKDFIFDHHPATALYIYDQPRGLTYVYMAFGDERSHTVMKGTCHADDLDERDRILHTFMTATCAKG